MLSRFVLKRRRLAMQFGYDARPSFWQQVKSNSHIVIAAAGTLALLCVAATAFWLAMPAGDRQAFAQIEDVPEAASAESEVVTVAAVEKSATVSAETELPVSASQGEAAGVPASSQGKGDADSASLTANDPRWSGKAPAKASASAALAAQASETGIVTGREAPPPLPTPEQAASVAAYQAEPASNATAQGPDGARTASIPDESASAEKRRQNGHILRAVTMRAGPKKGATALGTIPAKASVEVVSCKAWCQVVYKGKRGWIYKSFVKRDG